MCIDLEFDFIFMPKLKIALIDDDQARAEYIKTCLIQHDFDVVASLTLDHLNVFKLEHSKNAIDGKSIGLSILLTQTTFSSSLHPEAYKKSKSGNVDSSK